VRQTTQVKSFIDSINDTSLCYTPDYTGKLVPVGIRRVHTVVICAQSICLIWLVHLSLSLVSS